MEFGFFILIFYLTLFVRIFCLVTNARERTHNVGLPTICLSCVFFPKKPRYHLHEKKKTTQTTLQNIPVITLAQFVKALKIIMSTE